MLLNYVKLAIRLLFRNPFFTCINVLGLSVGFAVFFILWPFAQAELKTDQFLRDYDKIARLSMHIRWTDDNENWDEMYMAVGFCGSGTIVKENFSEVTDLTRIVPQHFFKKYAQGSDQEVLISTVKDNSRKVYFRETTTAYADSNFFQFFSFPLVIGQPDEVLSKTYAVVLSETSAKKYFGNADPRNKIIYLNDSLPLTVTGVFKDLPQNTHFQFDLLISTVGIKNIDIPSFDWVGYNYIKVNNGDFKSLNSNILKSKTELWPPNPSIVGNFFIQPLPEIAFTNLRENVYNTKSKQPLVLLNIISFIILGLAWVNYVGLSTNMLNKRMAEIGTRKTVGATHKNFMMQFLIESAIINIISFLLALTMVQLIGKAVMRLFGFYFIAWNVLSIYSIIVIMLMLVAGILLTGFYPVWIAAKRKPLELLKKLKATRGPSWVNWIVTFQYASAIILLIWIIAVYTQLDLILNKDIGIDKEAILVVKCPLKQNSTFDARLQSYFNKIRGVKGVVQVTFSTYVPGDIADGLYAKKSANSLTMALDTHGGVDEGFIPLYGIKLLAGRNFQEDRPIDKTTVLISDAAVKRIGFKNVQEAVGMKLILPNNGNRVIQDSSKKAEIIGVYKEYEFRPFLNGQREEGRGSILTYGKNLVEWSKPNKISIKVDMSESAQVIAALEALFKSTFPEDTFDWTFLEDNIERHYRNEKIARNQITLFTIIAIFIACLGLLGMISTKATDKTKEIGIRKVLGARIYHIAQILLKATVVQISIATAVSIPLGNYLIKEYLEKFSERITLQWWHYAIPVVILIVIMFTTVVSVLIKAARTNPVESLRYE